MGDGRGVDLYKLFSVVKGKGGYDAVCDSMTWDVVALESGFDSRVGTSVKLVYIKYLSVLDSWLKNVAGCGDGGKVPADYSLVDSRDKFKNIMMELHNGFPGLFEHLSYEYNEAGNSGVGGGGEELKNNVDGLEGVSLVSNGDKGVENGGHRDVETLVCVLNEVGFERYCKGLDDENTSYVLEQFDGEEVPAKAATDFSKRDGRLTCRKRKGYPLEKLLRSISNSAYSLRRRNPVRDMLSWISSAAANPCDPIVGLMPEKLKWEPYSGEAPWKKVLLFREATFADRSFESSTEQKYWLAQKTHPFLYDEDPEAISKFRSSSKSLLEAQRVVIEPPTRSSRLGPCFQAVLPDWTGKPSQSEPKWYGTKIWPSEIAISRLIERDPMGKGRQDSCGCPELGSEDCVRFHISEKRSKVKLEFGPAFEEFSFDNAGEAIRRLWTNDEEEKFNDVVQSVISSRKDKYLWDDIFRSFPERSREDLVSYYYNVFLYQRRGYQNRHTPDDIDSDDEEVRLRITFGRMTLRPGN